MSCKYLFHVGNGFHGLKSVSIPVIMIVGIDDESKIQNYYILQLDSIYEERIFE